MHLFTYSGMVQWTCHSSLRWVMVLHTECICTNILHLKENNWSFYDMYNKRLILSVYVLNMSLKSFHPPLSGTERCWNIFPRVTDQVFRLSNLQVTYWECSSSFRLHLLSWCLAFWICVTIFPCLLKTHIFHLK